MRSIVRMVWKNRRIEKDIVREADQCEEVRSERCVDGETCDEPDSRNPTKGIGARRTTRNVDDLYGDDVTPGGDGSAKIHGEPREENASNS
jgi:hypothetical protein